MLRPQERVFYLHTIPIGKYPPVGISLLSFRHGLQAGDIQQFHRINERSKLVTIPGASHRFLEPGAWDMVLDLTRDWFEFEQVLVADWE